MLLAIMLLLTAQDAPPPPAAVVIVCKGQVEGRSSQPGFVRDQASAPGDSLTVQLDGEGGAKVRVPAALIPAVHGGAKDGWWTLKALRVDKAEIAGVVSFNLFDKAHVIVDKGLGVASADSNLGRFVGKCEKGEAP